MSYYEPCGSDELFVGNALGQLPEYLRQIRSARLGMQALDINGDRLPEAFRPIFIARADLRRYDEIMMVRFRAAARGVNPEGRVPE